MPKVKKRTTINIDLDVYENLVTLKEGVLPGMSMTSLAVNSILLYCRLQKLGKLHEVSTWGTQDLNGNVYTGGN